MFRLPRITLRHIQQRALCNHNKHARAFGWMMVIQVEWYVLRPTVSYNQRPVRICSRLWQNILRYSRIFDRIS